MSDHTTRIVDLPDNFAKDSRSSSFAKYPITMSNDTSESRNISIQMPPQNGLMTMSSAAASHQPSMGIPSTNTRTDYDPQNPTYTPMNIHPNPYGNSIEPAVMPLPQPKYQSPPQQTMMECIPDPMTELHSMPHVRLPSRDIPMDQLHFQQDEEIQPNYIPKPKLTKDYVREYEEAAEKSAQKYEKTKRQTEQIEDAMMDFQLPILVAVLFFLFQIPVVHNMMYRYLSSIPIFHSDGNLNFYGILFKSAMFGSAFLGLQKFIYLIS